MCLAPITHTTNAWDIGSEISLTNAATIRPPRRLEDVMKQSNGTFGLIVGAMVAVAAVMFILGGGEWSGKQTIESDRDLPPLADGGR